MVNDFGQNEFIYQPLAAGHIRLLCISGDMGKPIYKLFHEDLTSAPKYSVLSYTWDGQARDHELLLNDSSFKVIGNIKTLLPYLFDKYHSQNIWIDGICINQDDDKEKEIQVPLMRKIYTQAGKCIVWLGESTPSLEMAILTIPTLVEKFQNCNSHPEQEGNFFAAQVLPILTPSILAALNDLFSKSWFTRVWTFQEAVLPEIVETMCGMHFISFDTLIRISESLLRVSLSGSIESITDSVDRVARSGEVGMRRVLVVSTTRNQLFSQPTTKHSFLELLENSWNWSYSDPRDKIYGLLGLADLSLQDVLTIDYSKSPAEVYLAFARCWIPRDPHLKIFHMISTPDPLLALATWCPNFKTPPLATPLGPLAPNAQYRAGLDASKNAQAAFVSGDPRAVQVEGFRVDEITAVLPCPWERQNHVTPEVKRAGIAEMLEWERRCLELSQRTYGVPDDVPDAHWRTLIANNHADGQRYAGRGRETYHLVKGLLSALAGVEMQLPPPGHLEAGRPAAEAQRLAVQDYAESFGYSSHGRSFFSTRGGRVGLSPPHAKPGDVVCIFYNACTPFIIRPGEATAIYAGNGLIGEAYVDGLMYGEAFAMGDRKPDELFTLV